MSTLLLCLPADRIALVEPYRAELERLAPAGMQVIITSDQEAVAQIIGDAEILAGGLPPELLRKAVNLRWYQQWGAGADWLMRHPESLPAGAVLTNMSGLHAVQISEHILSYILAFARNLPAAIRMQEQHIWQPAGWDQLFELPGKVLLLLGLGGIGSRTAMIASALGLYVIGVRNHSDYPAEGVAELYDPQKLPELWPRADFTAVALPLTPATNGLIGKTELRMMKPSSYLINIGRGGIIDEPALIQALSEGWIAGAGLDVFANEPLPADSPLWDMPNVIITAHYAGRTSLHEQGAMAILLDNLKRYTTQQPLRNVVDRVRGY